MDRVSLVPVRHDGGAGEARGPIARYAIRAAAVAVIAAAVVFAVRNTSPSEVFRVFASARLRMLFLFVPIILAASFVLRAARFGALLGEQSGVRFRHVLASVLVSQAANNVLPLRAGELVRTRDFVVRGVPLVKVAAAQIIEKLVELVTLLIWIVPVASFGIFATHRILATAAFIALSMVVFAFGAGRLRGAGRGRDLLAALAWSFMADGLEVALIFVCAHSLGIPAGLKASLMVLGAVNLAIALPSTPGNLGALEAGAALGLIAAGIPRGPAVAFALLYRCVQWLPVTLAGAGVFWFSAGRPALGGAFVGRSRA